MVERGLIVLFFVIFCKFYFFSVAPWKRLNGAIFGLVLLFLVFFSLPPSPGNFSADTLDGGA